MKCNCLKKFKILPVWNKRIGLNKKVGQPRHQKWKFWEKSVKHWKYWVCLKYEKIGWPTFSEKIVEKMGKYDLMNKESIENTV